MLFYFKVILGVIICLVSIIFPVSYKFHEILINSFLNINNIKMVVLLSAIIGIILYHIREISNILKGSFRWIVFKDRRWYKEWQYLLMATIYSFGYFIIKKLLSIHLSYLSKYICIFLIVNGLLLLVFKINDGKKEIEYLSFKDKLKLLIYEIFSFIPGISNNTMNIIFFKNLGINNQESFNLYCYLILVPLIFELFSGINNFDISNNFIFYILILFLGIFFTYILLFTFRYLYGLNKLKIVGVYCISISLITCLIILWKTYYLI